MIKEYEFRIIKMSLLPHPNRITTPCFGITITGNIFNITECATLPNKDNKMIKLFPQKTSFPSPC